MKPLLSICIPTYGHDLDLRVMLKTLTSLKTFRDNEEVEVVISDNCSPDGTEKVCRKFVEEFPGRVRYFRNETNVGDSNFGLSLTRGEGEYCKLANDTILFREEGLKKILDAVKEHREKKPVLFFTNQQWQPEHRHCETLSEFIDAVSMFSTWIGSFGIWKEELKDFKDFDRMRALYLTQVDVLCREISQGRHVEVYNGIFSENMPRPEKGGYSVSRIFGKNYFIILKPYVESGHLTKAAYKLEKKRILRRQILPFSLTFSHAFGNDGYFKDIFANYWTDWMYWAAMPFVIAATFLKKLKKVPLPGFIIYPLHRLSFRRRNRHNSTYPAHMFRHGCVNVGKDSSGALNIKTDGCVFDRLLIENRVKIGKNVLFDFVTDGGKGPIVVEDDVIIGDNSVIRSGVIIRRGTVVPENSVVAKDL